MMKQVVTEKEKKLAAEVHPYDYLTAKGVGLQKKGRYFAHPDHDSLQINSNGKWYWNSRGVGGYGAISLAKSLYDLGYLEAVIDINQTTNGLSPTDFTKHVKGKFNYPSYYETKNTDSIFSYLTEKRMLDKEIVQSLIDQNLIVQDKLNNIIFKWMENGEIVGATIQGTKPMENGGYFKNIMENSKEDGAFYFDVGQPNKIAFFESVIDGISYLQLKPTENIRIVGLSGLKPQAVMNHLKQFLAYTQQHQLHIENVIIAVDNDKAGKEFSMQWEHVIGEEVLLFEVPQKKDWNEDLIELKKNELTLERK